MEGADTNVKGLILVADDDEAWANAFCQMLHLRGYQIYLAFDKASILSAIAREQFQLLTLDLNWGANRPDGLDILREVRQYDSCLPVVILTGDATFETAVSAIKMGAFDYIEKGKDKEKAFITINNAIVSGLLLRENENILKQLRDQYPIVGLSDAVKELRTHIERVGPVKLGVLITGATGTGKELVARNIHYASSRRNKIFLPVDLGSLPESLVESTLFGYKKGAFTGANTDQPGYFDEANNGTIFLDEISNISLATQAILLRVTQSGQYYPVGSTELKTCNVRIIAATNVDLSRLIQEGKFREDLYYRINEYEIKMPSLDERKEDIHLLAKHFADINSRLIRGYPMQFNADATNILIEKKWPGNVRQLENAIKRIIVYSKEYEITREDVLSAFCESVENDDQSIKLEAVTRKCRKEHIIKVLNLCHGNMTKAAEALGIDRGHLYRLVEEYAIKQMAKGMR